MGGYLPNLRSEWETTGLDGGNPSKALETYLAKSSPESLVLQLSHLCLSLERPQCVLRAESGERECEIPALFSASVSSPPWNGLVLTT